MKYKIQILGNTYTGKTKKEIITNAGITLRQLNDILKGDTRKLIYNKETKEVDVIDIRKPNTDIKPLLTKKFTNFNKELLRKITHINNNEILKEISSISLKKIVILWTK